MKERGARLPTRRWTDWSLRAMSVLVVTALVGLWTFNVLELTPWESYPPKTVRPFVDRWGWRAVFGLQLAVAVIFAMGALFNRPGSARAWVSHGALLGLMVTLLSEMYGFSLFAFILSPALTDAPIVGEQLFARYGGLFVSIGTAVFLVGGTLYVASWMQLYRSRNLIETGGFYRLMRHPQYAGLILFAIGWLVHWPSLLGFVLFPALVCLYVSLAVREERSMARTVPDDWFEYRARTRPFLPLPLPAHRVERWGRSVNGPGS